MEDRRRCARYRLTSRLEFFIDGNDDKIFEGMTTDVSQHGFCFFTKADVKPGQRITLSKTVMPFDCPVAEVRWVNNNGAYCEAGMRCESQEFGGI